MNTNDHTPAAEKAQHREAVAAALYRHSRIVEAQDRGEPDPNVYAGWFPWDNLGTGKQAWLRAADVAIAAMSTPPASGAS